VFHNRAEDLYVWLTWSFLFELQSNPLFPFLHCHQRVDDDRDLLAPRASWSPRTWRGLDHIRIPLKVDQLIALRHTFRKQNHRRNRPHFIETVITRDQIRTEVLRLSGNWKNVAEEIVRAARGEWRGLQVIVTPFDHIDFWARGHYRNGENFCVVRSWLRVIRIRENSRIEMQKRISLWYCPGRIHRPD
jgi:hypothetical protein